MTRRTAQLILAACLLLWATCWRVESADVPLAWTLPTEYPDGMALDLGGVMLYWGREPSNYSEHVAVGPTNAYVLRGLVAGTWYITGAAYSTSGVESDTCEPVEYRVAFPILTEFRVVVRADGEVSIIIPGGGQ